MSIQKKFALFAAAPLAIAAVAGTAAFTAANDTVTLAGATAENVDYLYPASGTTTATVASFNDDQGTAVATKEGHLPEWFQVADGASAVPSEIQEAGDLLYVSTFSNDSTDDGNIISGLQVRANIVNLPEINNSYASGIVPIKVYNTADAGTTWTDITDEVFGVTAGDPYYVDFNTGAFDFTLRGDANLDEHYVVTVEQGGSIVPLDANSPVVQPQFTFQSTPLTTID